MFERTKKTLQSATRTGTYRIQQQDDNENRATTRGNRTYKLNSPTLNKLIKIKVLFLDESFLIFEIEKSAKASKLFQLVCQHLELVENDYFGLQFNEAGDEHLDEVPFNNPNLRWLELSKQIKKQLRLTKSIESEQQVIISAILYFRVKFYIEDPSLIQHEYTRYHLYLQIKKDVQEGRLVATPTTLNILYSYQIQSTVGDFNPEEHDEFSGQYIKSVVKTDLGKDSISKIVKLHKSHKLQTPSDAEYNYILHAKRLELYGITFHSAKDINNKDINIGICSNGIYVYFNGIRINTFGWCKIIKISFKRKCFYLLLRREVSEDYDTLLVFNCWNYKSCKRLWKCCIENHSFYRTNTNAHNLTSNRTSNLFKFGSRFRYSLQQKTEYQTREDVKINPSNSSVAVKQSSAHNLFSRLSSSSPSKRRHGHFGKENDDSSVAKSSKSHNKRTNDKIKCLNEIEPKKAWIENQDDSNDNGGFTSGGIIASTSATKVNHQQHHPLTNGISFVDDDEDYAKLDQGHDSTTVTINLKPDKNGRFGFNIKGGFDMDCPVLVSRVLSKSPADQGYPRVNEGDHLIQVNGQDTLKMLHLEVVNLIRQSGILNSKLVLLVRQNVYTTEDFEEPSFQYVPEIPNPLLLLQQQNQSQLLSSILLLEECLESNTIINQFELIYRRLPGLTCDVSKMPDNVDKNRYRDILPYDTTRVVLQNSTTGDYINANYVTMEIPVSGIVNRYIACQGPLSSTCGDFWTMVWETQSPLIVMLTSLYERGRTKCHPYWPQYLSSILIYSSIKIILLAEDIKPYWIERKFHLIHTESNEERIVVQLQFQSWPDHGIPEDNISFIKFIEHVRRAKLGTFEPMIVHCSAGIGRTGVLILMETAECLIEANQPIYPFDLVLQMRRQRPLLIQTSSQYRFVCQSILKVFQQGIIRPLPEFAIGTGACT